MATNVNLTPELEKFARSCVESGRYNNISEVVRTALRLLQSGEERRRDFTAMLAEVRAETDRHGAVDLTDVATEMDAIIAAAER